MVIKIRIIGFQICAYKMFVKIICRITSELVSGESWNRAVMMQEDTYSTFDVAEFSHRDPLYSSAFLCCFILDCKDYSRTLYF